jgi:XTP/dITP diphosphohydrolase
VVVDSNAAPLAILFASTNPDKFIEVRALLAKRGIRVLNPTDFLGSVPDVAETGATFAENALLKAQAFSLRYSQPVVAEDTGLSVHALGGEPGVHSNRWFQGTTTERNVALLERLAPYQDRSASFTTVACLCLPDGESHFFEGVLHGTLSLSAESSTGFGYDPIFIPDGYTESLATIGLELKNQFSHRAQAFEGVVDYLSRHSLVTPSV